MKSGKDIHLVITSAEKETPKRRLRKKNDDTRLSLPNNRHDALTLHLIASGTNLLASGSRHQAPDTRQPPAEGQEFQHSVSAGHARHTGPSGWLS